MTGRPKVGGHWSRRPTTVTGGLAINAAAGPNWLVLPILPLFAGAWIAACLLISTLGGWRQLAKSYRRQGTVLGTSWWFQSASMRVGASYNNCLFVTVNREGLGVAILPLYRACHPPLFFPWREVSASRYTGFLGIEQLNLTFAREPTIPFRVSRRLARKIADTVGELKVE